MRRDLVIGAALAAALFCRTAHADPLAYLRATSQYERDANPAAYHPLNLLDDDSTTMWCEGAPGLGEGEEIRFFFKKEQRIDRIIVGPADGTGRLVRVVKVTDGINSVRIDLGNVYSEMSLKRPLSGSTYVVTIEEVGAGNTRWTIPRRPRRSLWTPMRREPQ
ncbi:MAG: hypothetical protein V3T05_13500, partial [Myxococcota bacterium]